MLTRKKPQNRRKLTHELLGLMVIDLLLSLCAYFFIRSWAGSLAAIYCEKKGIGLDDLESIALDYGIMNLSIISAVIIFLLLFFAFVGRKLGYIGELTAGIDALRTHQMNHEIGLKQNNELTELAENINYLAETERKLKAVQRNLSHDIRTPLTAILSYTEYMESRQDLSPEELSDFLGLTRQKAQQMKVLTERLLDGGVQLTEVEDGRLLMAQLAAEWEETLEDAFFCETNLSGCPVFYGQFDLEELRRIFDNLASNVEKYADVEEPVRLSITTEQGRIAIKQSNKKTKEPREVESRKIGLDSIDRIAKHYGGGTRIEETDAHFTIGIILFEV